MGGGVSDQRDSHPDDVLHVEVLQWRDVGVVTLVVLQDHLLDDAVQQQPVLHRVAAPLICRGAEETLVSRRRLSRVSNCIIASGSAAADEFENNKSAESKIRKTKTISFQKEKTTANRIITLINGGSSQSIAISCGLIVWYRRQRDI